MKTVFVCVCVSVCVCVCVCVCLCVFAYAGHDIFQSGHETGSVKATLTGLSIEEQASYRLGCFHFLVYVTIVCAVLQLLFWQRFSLRGTRLTWVKAMRRGTEDTCVWCQVCHDKGSIEETSKWVDECVKECRGVLIKQIWKDWRKKNGDIRCCVSRYDIKKKGSHWNKEDNTFLKTNVLHF